ncbi:MAG: Calx-beta domain-containing protein, partial [Rubripirellula sp.]
MPSKKSERIRRRSSRRLTRQGDPLRRRPRIEALEDRRLLAAAPTISIDDVQQLEGDSGPSGFVFAVTRSGKVNQPSTIGYATMNDNAIAGEDYEEATGTLNFAAGERTKTITVDVTGDVTEEGDEQFFVDLNVFDNGRLGDGRGVGTIQNDDTAPALPTLSIDDVQLAEGDGNTTAFVFTVTRTGDKSISSSVEYQTADGTATTADSDYQAISATPLNFAVDEASKTITVLVNGDTDVEPHQFFTVELSGSNNATIADGIGHGTILDDDSTPIGLVSHWTADNTAVDNQGLNDGALVSGATYATGVIGQAFSFDGVDDRVQIEDDPSLQLTQSMTIEGWVRVDSFPTSGHGLVLFRGDDRGGLDPYHLTTTPSGQIQFMVSNLTQGATSLNAAMPQGELVYVAGTLEDATGEMSLYLNGERVAQKTTSIRSFGALDPESNPGIGIGNHGGYPSTPHNFPFHGLIDELKIHDVALSDAEILANFNAVRSISIDDVSLVEGDSGAAAFVFTVTPSGDTSQTSSVDFATSAGTATADVDYTGTVGTLTFPAGDSSPQTITVMVSGDTVEESHETFFVNLSNVVGATVVD